MKFTFENLGFIKKGEMELGDLTIICGKNNTGKTHVIYSIYGFIKYWQNLFEVTISDSLIDTLRNDGVLDIDLKEYCQKIPEYFANSSLKFSKELYQLFNTSDEYFKDSIVKCVFTNDIEIPQNEFTVKASYGKGKSEISLSKEEKENTLSIVLELKEDVKLPARILKEIISDAIVKLLFQQIFSNPYILTSERTGVSLFYTELDIHKNNLIKFLQDNKEIDFNPIKFITETTSRYAVPIHHNIDTVRDIKQIYKKKSFLNIDKKDTNKKLIKTLLMLVDGKFKLIGEQIMYIPKNDKTPIPIYLASSSVKSLFLLDAYIHNLAQVNDILMIDEPELNLHPDKQIIMARLIVQLVNVGIISVLIEAERFEKLFISQMYHHSLRERLTIYSDLETILVLRLNRPR